MRCDSGICNSSTNQNGIHPRLQGSQGYNASTIGMGHDLDKNAPSPRLGKRKLPGELALFPTLITAQDSVHDYVCASCIYTHIYILFINNLLSISVCTYYVHLPISVPFRLHCLDQHFREHREFKEIQTPDLDIRTVAFCNPETFWTNSMQQPLR